MLKVILKLLLRAYRSLRTNIGYLGIDQKKVIPLTSASPTEGNLRPVPIWLLVWLKQEKVLVLEADLQSLASLNFNVPMMCLVQTLDELPYEGNQEGN